MHRRLSARTADRISRWARRIPLSGWGGGKMSALRAEKATHPPTCFRGMPTFSRGFDPRICQCPHPGWACRVRPGQPAVGAVSVAWSSRHRGTIIAHTSAGSDCLGCSAQKLHSPLSCLTQATRNMYCPTLPQWLFPMHVFEELSLYPGSIAHRTVRTRFDRRSAVSVA